MTRKYLARTFVDHRARIGENCAMGKRQSLYDKRKFSKAWVERIIGAIDKPAGKTARAGAEYAGIDESTMSRLLNGRMKATAPRVIARLTHFYGVRPDVVGMDEFETAWLIVLEMARGSLTDRDLARFIAATRVRLERVLELSQQTTASAAEREEILGSNPIPENPDKPKI